MDAVSHVESSLASAAANAAAMQGDWALSADVVDARSVAPQDRYPLVLGHVAWLEPGQALRLVLDCDPAPVQRHLVSHGFGSFQWTSARVGDELWKVQVRCLGPGQDPAAT